MSSAHILLLRIPSLKIRVKGRKEVFEVNLKTETELWNLMVKEMCAGRSMADQHKVQFSSGNDFLSQYDHTERDKVPDEKEDQDAVVIIRGRRSRSNSRSPVTD